MGRACNSSISKYACGSSKEQIISAVDTKVVEDLTKELEMMLLCIYY
jgi:hypothetical protein